MRRTIALLVLLLTAGFAAPLSADPSLVVIVHPSRPDSPPREEIARIFLKQRRFWKDGTAIVPVNRESGSPLREAFSRRVLGRGSADLVSYWNEQYFQGVFPPLTLSSTASVKRYVATEPGAIGYIETTEADATVRVVASVP